VGTIPGGAAAGSAGGRRPLLQPGVVEGNKISLMFTGKDGPGSLKSILGAFDKHSINLTRIESRPSKRYARTQPLVVTWLHHDPRPTDSLRLPLRPSAATTPADSPLVPLPPPSPAPPSSCRAQGRHFRFHRGL
jgi:hypothetical protein